MMDIRLCVSGDWSSGLILSDLTLIFVIGIPAILIAFLIWEATRDELD